MRCCEFISISTVGSFTHLFVCRLVIMIPKVILYIILKKKKNVSSSLTSKEFCSKYKKTQMWLDPDSWCFSLPFPVFNLDKVIHTKWIIRYLFNVWSHIQVPFNRSVRIFHFRLCDPASQTISSSKNSIIIKWNKDFAIEWYG